MINEVRAMAHESLSMQQAKWLDRQYADAIRHHLKLGEHEEIPLHDVKERCVVSHFPDGRSVFSMDNIALLEMYKPDLDMDGKSLTITTKFKRLYD